MIIYCDGGAKESKKYGKGNALLSWGIRIEDASGPTELFGSKVVPRALVGKHETVAFIEAVIYAHAHNGNTLNTKFVTDAIGLSYFHRPVLREHLYTADKRIKSLINGVKTLYSEATLKLAEQYLIFAQISWVKGHQKCINHNRADYLATVARQIATDPSTQVVSFEEWLSDGHIQYGASGHKLWHAPFCSPETK